MGLIADAQKKFEGGDAWMQDGFYSSVEGKVLSGVCALGALRLVAGTPLHYLHAGPAVVLPYESLVKYDRARDILADTIVEQYPAFKIMVDADTVIMSWNDVEGREFGEVEAIFEKAAIKEEESE